MNESTHEILKRLAPEFVGLDEAEREHKAAWRPADVFRTNDWFNWKARDAARSLLDAHAQALVRVEKAKKFIDAFTLWEADVIQDGAVWATQTGLPALTQELYDRWAEGPESLQALRNDFLKKIGE